MYLRMARMASAIFKQINRRECSKNRTNDARPERYAWSVVLASTVNWNAALLLCYFDEDNKLK